MSEWKEVRLSEVTSILGDGIHGTPVYSEQGDYYFINGNNLCEGRIVLKPDTKRVSEEEYHKHKKELNSRTLLFSINGTVGNVAKYNGESCILGKSACYFNVLNTVDKDFIYYVISSSSFVKSMSNLANGTTIKNVSLKQMRDKTFLLPSLETQQRISSILSSLDSKIENNRKICANLEAQAQALFKHWFIDFAPFKDGKFVESELGMIPEALIYKRIEDMPHTLETGKRPAGGVKGIDNGVPSIGAENIKGLGCYDYSKTKYVTKEYFDSMKKGVINGYELLIYKDGGKPGYFIPNFAIFGEGYPYKEMCLNEHVFKLDFGNKGYSLFAYFFFKTKQIMSYLNAQGAKAAIPGINSKDIEVVMMPSLDNEFVQNYCNEVEDILTHILVLSKESYRLSTLRDTLLPKLMSGEIKV